MRSDKVLGIEEFRSRVKNRKPVAAFVCEVCGRLHPSEDSAKACGGGWREPAHKVGDIVVMELGYGWFDGKPDWVLQHAGHKFHEMRTHAFWMVITDITQKDERDVRPEGEPNAHRFVYHVATLGLHNGMTTYGGWTDPDTHKRIGAWSDESLNNLTPPASVIEEAKALVGKRFDRLL